MKSAKEWADKFAVEQVRAIDPHAMTTPLHFGVAAKIARALRAAEKRGFRRAVKLLREHPKGSDWFAAWLEEQERK